MKRIEQAFAGRGASGTLIPFLTAGDPDVETSLALFRAVLAAGADIVEIGVPYSDPLADGPVIQSAALRSLTAGFSLPMVFDLTRAIRQDTDKGLVLFTYINPVLQYGPERFFHDAAIAGADGVIIPDLPHEESHQIRAIADNCDVALIPLVTPVSPPERIAAICADARGFVYLVSTLGVTGERSELSTRVADLAAEVRKHTNLPIAVGFGVSRPEHAVKIMRFADGVIIGSAFIRQIEEALNSATTPAALQAQLIHRLKTFADAFRTAMSERRE